MALFRNEAFEQHLHPSGVHFGDPERVAHRGVRHRAAALAEDALAARVFDNVVDGEEVGLIAEFRDQREFVLDLVPDFVRHHRT